jgi:formylglycine-generating enzyme required for sulfatase activity
MLMHGRSIGPDTSRSVRLLAVAGLAVAALTIGRARADVDPNSGIDFVRVGAIGNAPWAGNGTVGDRAVGRGSVGYEYKIGKMEVTTAQWVEFFNAAFDRPSNDLLPHLTPPDPGHWGAQSTTPMTPGAKRWNVAPGQALHPVGDISWRMAAMYCNWLSNGKSLDRSAFLNGAYDASTFGSSGSGFTDQQSHNPEAKYWIPTWDEWLKAAHFDPSKNGGAGGWWLYDTSSDTTPVYGPAGQLVGLSGNGTPFPDPTGQPAQANGGWTSEFSGFSPFDVLLGAYPTVQSPWGLLDTAGGTSEWTEETIGAAGRREARYYDGSHWFESSGNAKAGDWIGSSGSDFPSLATYDLGFRIASVVPAPASIAPVIGVALFCSQRTRKQGGFHADKTLSRTPDPVLPARGGSQDRRW